MTTRRDFLKVLGAALGVAALPGAVVEAAARCATPADEADLLEAVLGKREAYALRQSGQNYIVTRVDGDEGQVWIAQWSPGPLDIKAAVDRYERDAASHQVTLAGTFGLRVGDKVRIG